MYAAHAMRYMSALIASAWCCCSREYSVMAEYEYNAEEIDAEEDGGERVRACQIGPASPSQPDRS